FPFIAHGRTQTDKPYAWFDYDNANGIRLAVQHLLELGHQRISLISAPLELNFARQRRTSFVEAMSSAGLDIDTRYLIQDALDRRSGYLAVQQLLNCSPRPSAIIVDNHLSGVGAMRALMDAGITIGRDISVIVWGNMEDTLVGDQVTTIDQPDPRAAGTKMSEMLLALMNGTPAADLQVLWQPVLIAGSTTGPM
ncbi:MAG: substrate-binding domain-containing protein, partial [Burkholderiales bacterium]|nr:substrate-binding domain-containing protein [Burkholderiales bacterium]